MAAAVEASREAGASRQSPREALADSAKAVGCAAGSAARSPSISGFKRLPPRRPPPRPPPDRSAATASAAPAPLSSAENFSSARRCGGSPGGGAWPSAPSTDTHGEAALPRKNSRGGVLTPKAAARARSWVKKGRERRATGAAALPPASPEAAPAASGLSAVGPPLRVASTAAASRSKKGASCNSPDSVRPCTAKAPPHPQRELALPSGSTRTPVPSGSESAYCWALFPLRVERPEMSFECAKSSAGSRGKAAAWLAGDDAFNEADEETLAQRESPPRVKGQRPSLPAAARRACASWGSSTVVAWGGGLWPSVPSQSKAPSAAAGASLRSSAAVSHSRISS